MKSDHDPNEIINMVALIRTANNILWMDLLKLAVNKAPDEARAIIDKINKNDKEVTKWLKKL